MRFQKSVLIHCPRHDVFEFSTAFENFPKWRTNLRDVELTSGYAIAAGSTYNATIQILGTELHEHGEITDYRLDELVSIKGRVPNATLEMTAEFVSQESSTRVNIGLMVTVYGALGLLESLIGGVLERVIQTDLNRLKSVVETYCI